MPEFDSSVFKDKVVIFCVVHYHEVCVRACLANIISIIDAIPDVYMVLIDSHSEAGIQSYLETIKHSRIHKVSLELNVGYMQAINYYIKEYISDRTLPRCIVRFDSDIVFDKGDFEKLIDAIAHLPRYGAISMTYKDNVFNPERYVRKGSVETGSNGKRYTIRRPFLTPVAGGIMGLRGEVLRDGLDYQLFHPKHLPKRYRHISSYGGADAALYGGLKWRYRMGYLADTEAVHLRSGEQMALIPEKYAYLFKKGQ